MASKKRKRRRAEPPRKKGGVMIGMRRGFKKAATAVAGPSDKQAKKRSWLGTAITIALVAAAAALLYYRNR
jgi:hypothetical protein